MKRALLLTLLVRVALEIVTRVVLFPASGDFVRFAGYDTTAAALSRSPALRVAIVGNSAAEEGIDRTRLEGLLSQSLDRPVRVEMFLADGSEIVTWHAMLVRYFWSRHKQADVYVLNYFGTVADNSQFEFLRIGMFFAPASQWSYYLKNQLHTLPQRVEFVLSAVWATFGARDRIRDRALSEIVPNYEVMLRRLRYAPERGVKPVAPRAAPTFDALERILARANEQRARVVVTAFPMREGRYVLEGQLVALAQRKAVGLIDMRVTPGLSRGSYRDDIHLVASGREIYTRQFAAALSTVLTNSNQAAD